MAEQIVGRPFQQLFFERHPSLRAVMELFEYAPGAYFYAKDSLSRFVRLNHANLALYGVTDEEPLLGRSDRDFHPPSLAEAYIAEDQLVIGSGRPIVNQTWLVPFLHGPLQWFVSSKLPMRSHEGDCIGVIGVMYEVATPQDQMDRFQRLAPAVRYLEEHYREPLQLAELTDCCGLSPTHVHRLFKRLLRMSPNEYLLALRMQEARRLLATTTEPLSVVAMRTGFFDQSHFTKRFRRTTGMTPAEYRKAFG